MLIAKHRGILDEVVWWREEIDTEKSIDELADELDGSVVGW
jgi:hypothetical protein